MGKLEDEKIGYNTTLCEGFSIVVGGKKDSSRKAKDYFKGLLQGLINHNWAHVLSMK